jgi:hypothetical protein
MCAKENPKGKFPIIPCDLSNLKAIPDATAKIGQEFGNVVHILCKYPPWPELNNSSLFGYVKKCVAAKIVARSKMTD